MTFASIGVIEPILRALQKEGYTEPTPIQAQSIPKLLEGDDLLACAQTGTGKTAAFAIPIIQQLYQSSDRNRKPRQVRALVVTPTRELAIQIADSFSAYGRFTGIRNTVIFGGVKPGRQIQLLKRGVDVLVATPGRLLDLMGQGYITLRHVEHCVLDEADRMLDMGFIHDIRKIIAKLPEERQSLFFSATMPPDIVKLSRQILGGDPARVTVKPEQPTAEKVEQSVYFVSKKMKRDLLLHLLKDRSEQSTLVFSRTKYGADKIVKQLRRARINADAIHGNKSQNARQRALNAFKKGDINVLVATDIAARGIDVDELALVINYDLPNIPETYVHRIGRTGRAKASGIAISFCDTEEKAHLRSIQRLIRQDIPVIYDHPFAGSIEEEAPVSKAPRGNRRPPRSKGPSNQNKSRNNFRGRRSQKRRAKQ